MCFIVPDLHALFSISGCGNKLKSLSFSAGKMASYIEKSCGPDK